MTRVTVSADWLDNHAQYPSSEDEVEDRELLLHYIYKSTLNGNFSCPFDNSMKKCLDIGYSSGYWMMEMATDFPECQFFGIDIEPSSPDLVHPKNCFFGKGDYLKGLPYQSNMFDVVYIRSLSTLGTPDQILHLISEVSRVTKTGGYIEFLELDPNSGSLRGPLLEKLMKIYVGNRAIDRQIVDILTDFGLVNIKNNKIPIPLSKGSMVGELLKLFVETVDARTKSKMNLGAEDDLLYLVEKECEEHQSYINIISGFAQKL